MDAELVPQSTGSGRDGSGRDGSGRDGSGRDGSGSDGLANEELAQDGAVDDSKVSTFGGRLLLLSAHDDEALKARLERVAATLAEQPSRTADLAYTLATGRKAFAKRAVVVLNELHQGAASQAHEDSFRQASRATARAGAGGAVLMFPGQGAQFLGMGRHLHRTNRVYREVFERCERFVHSRLQVNLRELLLAPAPSDDTERARALTQTAIAQPALFVVEYALARVLLDSGVVPHLLLGHSIGEYAAACLAGVFELEAALEVVCERGRLMQSMPPGGMLAINAGPEQMSNLLEDAVDLAAYNAPGSSVVSGPLDAIKRLEGAAQAMGLETRSLHTSHAFHSRMMDPILESFERVVEQARPRAPQIPIISSMTGKELSALEAASPEYWARQLRNPVRFADAARSACASAERVFVEVGPGVSLITFVAKLNDASYRPRRSLETLGHAKSDRDATEAMLNCLGQLWVENVPLDFDALYQGQKRRLMRLPTYPYQRKRHFITPPAVDHSRMGRSASSRAAVPAVPAAQADPARSARDPQQLVLEQVGDLVGTRLGRPLADDDLDRRFLELGFDSLALSQFAGKLTQQFDVRVPVRQLYDSLGTPRLLASHVASDPAVVARLVVATSQQEAVEEEPSSELPSASLAARLDRIEGILRRLQPNLDQALPVAQHEVVTARRADVEQVAELTASQSEVWIATRFLGTAANLAYNECRAFRFTGEVNVPALEASLKELCTRHEGLRMTFGDDGETCTTHPTLKFELARHELTSALGEAERRAQLEAVLQGQVQLPFDLGAGPLFRGVLVRCAEREHVLVLCAHHVVVDGSSWEILIRELSELYSARIEGRPPQLVPAVSFADYAAAERSYHASRESRDDIAYWLQHLEGQSDDLNLPTDRPRPAHRSFSATRIDQRLPEELVSTARAAAARASCTLQTFLLAAFQTLLFRLTRQADFICGVPTSGQAAFGMDPLVGHCVHVLPLRFAIDGNRTVEEHLAHVRDVMLDGLQHQRATFSELLPKLSRARDPSRPALIQAAFGMGRSQKRPKFSGLETRLSVVPRVSEAFELYVYVTEDQQGLEVSWSYNTDLFDRATVEHWQRCFATLVAHAAAARATEPIAKLPILSDEDRERILVAARGRAVEDPQREWVHEAIVRQAVTSAHSVAVIDENGSHTYAQLVKRANQVGHYLRSRGFAKNSLIGVCLNRSVDLVTTLLGVWRAGMGYVPIDPEYPSERVETILEDAHAACVITSRELVRRVPAQFNPICIEDLEPELLEQPEGPPIGSEVTSEGDTAYVIFTSGSTGRPKGVQISQGAFQNFIRSMAEEPGFTSADTLLAITTISFDISGLELFLPLVVGGKIVLATRQQAINPKEIKGLLAKHSPTVLQATPATWQMLFESGWQGDKGLKVLCGGEAFPRHLAEKFLACCGEVWNVYGPTETTVWSTAKRITDPASITIGRPIDNTTCYVLDEHRNLVPRGASGELWIGGHGVAIGYLGRPELTAERFVDSPFESGERIYATGDLARLRADGQFECLGRLDFQVKIRGFRIELGEVETAMLTHPGVKACVAVARDGELGEKSLVGYVVPRDGESIDTEVLRDLLLRKLPGYMVPSAFCVLDALPMTPNKKIDRKALPAPAAPTTFASTVETRDQLERKMLSLWTDVLKYPNLSPVDNFYAVGGHSLMAIRLLEQLNTEFQTDLQVNEFLSHPTVRGVSDLIRPQVNTEAKAPRESAARPDVTFRTAHRGLFLVQQGDEDTVPLFLIHGDRANALLAQHLSAAQEIWGYHHQGSDGERILLQTVEELAEHCHREWLAKNGDRPVIVGGHSFGALVAYHVAILRIREGLPTPRVVIIDARHPDALSARQPIVGPRSAKRRYHALRQKIEARQAIEQALARLNLGEVVPTELRRDYILGTYLLATLKYQPPVFRGHLEVLRSREFAERSPVDLWEKSAICSVRRVVLDGTHMSLVREPEGIASIANHLRRICGEVKSERAHAKLEASQRLAGSS